MLREDECDDAVRPAKATQEDGRRTIGGGPRVRRREEEQEEEGRSESERMTDGVAWLRRARALVESVDDERRGGGQRRRHALQVERSDKLNPSCGSDPSFGRLPY